MRAAVLLATALLSQTPEVDTLTQIESTANDARVQADAAALTAAQSSDDTARLSLDFEAEADAIYKRLRAIETRQLEMSERLTRIEKRIGLAP